MTGSPSREAAVPFTELLDLSPIDDDRFAARSPIDGLPRLFGGQVIAQALRAACLTVEEGRRPHSLHAYFMRPGRPGVPLELAVERSRDGRSFATRSVTVIQDGEEILVLIASFHVSEPGAQWQSEAPALLPGPDEVGHLPSPLPHFLSARAFEIRPIVSGDGGPRLHPCWIRLREPVGDDLDLHACALAFASDLGVAGSARMPGAPWGRFSGASLDHALWLHRPVRADQWLLFSVQATTNFGARGLGIGTMHTEAGILVASLAQEALLRPTGQYQLGANERQRRSTTP